VRRYGFDSELLQKLLDSETLAGGLRWDGLSSNAMMAETRDVSGGLARLAVLVPAWCPDAGLVPLVEALVVRGFGAVVVVDDGSGVACAPVFAAVAAVPGVHLLRHAVNLGKGRALKTGINYVLTELYAVDGLVTADADGQHRVADIVRVAQALEVQPNAAVLGVRTFAAGVPWRSRLGNGLTRTLFALLSGRKVADTQTGLRAFPRGLLAELLGLEGERYEYEMTVLAHLCRRGEPVEVAIETVYVDGNRGSRFRPVRDSARIYAALAAALAKEWR
jgi:glycosyltransferase involved in cell wall biosynthesis